MLLCVSVSPPGPVIRLCNQPAVVENSPWHLSQRSGAVERSWKRPRTAHGQLRFQESGQLYKDVYIRIHCIPGLSSMSWYSLTSNESHWSNFWYWCGSWNSFCEQCVLPCHVFPCLDSLWDPVGRIFLTSSAASARPLRLQARPGIPLRPRRCWINWYQDVPGKSRQGWATQRFRRWL